MSSRARPWWASDGPVDGGIARDEDPVERLRAARRGTGDHAAGDDLAEPWLDAVAATMSSLAGAATHSPDRADERAEANGARNGAAHTAQETGQEAAAAGHQPDVCGVCPICVGLRALAESRPELMNHLAEAARHVALAARSLRERPADAGDEARERAARPGDGRAREGLEHIDLE
jgi:hypothetical protein